MKKILLLGGANTQIPSILTAKKMGYYTITCDYLPDNPVISLQMSIIMLVQQTKRRFLHWQENCRLMEFLRMLQMLQRQQQRMFQKQWDFRPVLISQ